MDHVTKISPSAWLHCPLDAGRVKKISYIDKLPNEILQKILTEELLSSGFSWPSHVCQTYNVLKNVSVCFCHVTSRLAWALPSIHFATGGKAGKVGVKTLLCKFGPASGVMIEVKRVFACHDWKHAYLKFRFRRQGWFVIEYKKRNKKEQTQYAKHYDSFLQ